MEPSKQESVSRQSSILKAPKQRQPLQCVATNPSLLESSPTIKLKRRVSFAKNKRIREFCDEVEPKEGLDDSYEEHDLSNTKSSSGSTDHPLVISVACEDKENFPIQLFLPTDQFECKEVQAASSCAEGDNLSQSEMEMDDSINIFQPVNSEMQNNEMALPNKTIYCDDGMDITTAVQPQIIFAHVQEDNCYNDTVPVSQTRIQDDDCYNDTVPVSQTRMQENHCYNDIVLVSQTPIEDVPREMTENLQLRLSNGIVPQNTYHDANFEYNSLNVTEPVSTILGIGHVKKSIESQSPTVLSRNCENETECFTDMPLGFPSAIPSSTWIRPHNQSQSIEETERLNCKTMEFTEVVQLQNIVCKNKTEKINSTSEKIVEELLAQKDSKRSNTSIKQTHYSEVCQEKNNILSSDSIVTAEASSSQSLVNQTSNLNHNLSEKMQEKTKIFPNASMKISDTVSVYNEIKTLPLSIEGIQQETTQEKTKIFRDQSLKLTGTPNNELRDIKRSNQEQIQRQEKTTFLVNTSMEMTEIITNQNKIDQNTDYKNEVHKLNTSKSKVFFNTSMEMTEAVPICQKINRPIEIEGAASLGNVEDQTKLFNDNSMEVTEALDSNKTKKLNHCKNQLMAPGSEKTQLFYDASMEITEAVPINNKIDKSLVTTNKTHHEDTQHKTKFFYDKSMELTEAVLHDNRIPLLSKLDNQTLEPTNEKTKFFFNASMEITEGAPALLSKINEPVSDLQKIREDVTHQQTEFDRNKSMESNEATSVYHLVNHCTTGKENNQQEITEDRTKIFQNKSMEVTGMVLNDGKFNLFSKNQHAESGQTKTKFFFNASMEITETAPVVNKPYQLGSELKNVLCRNISEQTEIFQNKSMEITEAVKNPCSNNYHFEKSIEKSEIGDKVQEKARVLQNISVTETIPINKEIWQCNVENDAATLKQSKKVFENNKMMEQFNNLNENLGIKAANSDNKMTSVSRDEKTKYFNNKSMNFPEIRPVLKHRNLSSYVQNEVQNLMTDKTKDFFNNSMDINEAVMKNQNSFCANPPTLSSSVKDLESLHQYESIVPNNIDIQNSNHSSSKKDNVFNVSGYKDKSFQRITTDELNTLCASMNLPTQNYTTERSSTLQNDYMSICNDVNVLRDSLQKNTIFQQNFAIGTGINIAMDIDIDMQISTNVSRNSEKQILCDTNSDSVQRNVTPSKEKTETLLTEMESQKEYHTVDGRILKRRNLDISEIKSTELSIRNSPDQNMSSISLKSLKNAISSNDTEYSNYIFNDKQTCETQSNESLSKSEMLRMHKISANLSSIQKSSTKRKSTDIDESTTVAGNVLKRLPSDNTDLLIATMGFKTELSHPLIINDRTTIKIPCASLGNNAYTPSSCSDETTQPEENISREDERSSKNITTSMIQHEVFDEGCNSLNKENESPENKESNLQMELSLDNSMNKLEEIQPPSFLCSDSFQTDSIIDTEMLDNESPDEISREIIQEKMNGTYEEQYWRENSDVYNSKNSSTRETRQSFEKRFSPKNCADAVDTARHLNKENSEPVGKLAFFHNLKDVNESIISLINEEDVNMDPLAPFLSLAKSIEMCEKGDDCIWTIRKIDQKTVAVDFISRSFVTIIRLNEIEKACIKDIDDIEFISRLHCGSTNILLKIVHRLLLSKLKPDKLLSEYKMYEDILPLLDCVSNEVISAMNFMFDLERLSALNLLTVENERVLFMVSSKKANIILEISLMLKVFNEIGPDDINVTCVLGDVRINDIKQLIVNIRKDSSFLSRYISDVKDYIMLMEESTHIQR